MEEINVLEAFLGKAPQLTFSLVGLEAGQVGILAGAGGVGKGFLAIQLAATVADTSSNLDFLHIVKERGQVGYLAAEDSSAILKSRIYSFGKYLESRFKRNVVEEIITAIDLNMSVISVVGDMPDIKNRDWQKFLYNFAKGKKLIILDTLRRFSDLDENNSKEMSFALNFFEHIATNTGCSIILTHHLNKYSLKTRIRSS